MNLYETYCLPHLINRACSLEPITGLRRRIVPLAEGRVLEVGMGAALNLPYYDQGKVEFIWVLEPSEGVRKIARKNLQRASIEVRWLPVAAPEMSREGRRELAAAYLTMVGLGGTVKKYPFELSGGMQQRGAIARALALGSPALLLDEPFGALDPINRVRLQDLLLEIWRSEQPRKTVVFVTHDVEEALFLGDRVVVLGSSPGRVIADLEVPFPRPRKRQEVFADRRYRELRSRIDELYRSDILNRLSAEEEIRSQAEGI